MATTKGYLEKGDQNIGVKIYKTMLRIIYGSLINDKISDNRTTFLKVINDDNIFDQNVKNAVTWLQGYTGTAQHRFNSLSLTNQIDSDGDANGIVGKKTIEKTQEMVLYAIDQIISQTKADAKPYFDRSEWAIYNLI